ncbi:single-stranded DNA-binding protein [Actinoplanes sp. NEAU-A12]|uniref:Single-stranded DNA-binding protein n=1 Tax=Actinoplanes sandaracinus TaxID=3045177 RepID=A0ABT6WQL0_9ACTN|nr:single-stranded DNA-binding protein [Actinoplanes sandaracinus]MDI6102022.1 single-stranded DNA-binding protein [Actinoplanes sandaracinus]
MFETNIVVVGNVLTAPEWRRTSNNNALVANFRIASTARRYDRETGRWVDGNSLRVRVSAWRKLAEGVASSITVGDPVVVYGRIYTRDWIDDDNNNRVSYEMEAFAIGHDLARGRARFYRSKPAAGNSMIEGPDSDAIVGGETSVALAEEEIPVGFGDGLPERVPEEEEPGFLEVVARFADETAEAGDDPDPVVPVSAPPVETRRVRRASRREPVAA